MTVKDESELGGGVGERRHVPQVFERVWVAVFGVVEIEGGEVWKVTGVRGDEGVLLEDVSSECRYTSECGPFAVRRAGAAVSALRRPPISPGP